jgi:prepilin-type N-terminal cleavage/methylation domain-containing protein
MRHTRRRGFTLVELLVVIGIIVLLATFLLPMLQRVQSQARRASMAADLEVVSLALEAYKGDFGDYPRIDRQQAKNLPVLIGAPLLCWALVAPGAAVSSPSAAGFINPGDGADGPGFRLRGTVGPVKGPYLPPDRFLIGTVDGEGLVQTPGTVHGIQASFDDSQDVLADRNNSPILYFPATRGAIPGSVPNGFVKDIYVAPKPPQPATGAANPAVFIFDDNANFLRPPRHPGENPYFNPADLTRGGWQIMSYRLGDTNYNGIIDNGEVPITTGPYLLWSAGPDRIFGNDDDVMCDGAQLQPVIGTLPLQIMPP